MAKISSITFNAAAPLSFTKSDWDAYTTSGLLGKVAGLNGLDVTVTNVAATELTSLASNTLVDRINLASSVTTLSNEQYTSAVAAKLALAPNTSPINVSGVAASRVATLGQDNNVATMTVVDTAANVMANLASLQAANKLTVISNVAPISLSDRDWRSYY